MENIQQEGQEPETLDEKVEEEALEEKSEDEIRSEIIEKHGLDEVTDDSLIENMVTENLKMRKELSTAIKQKRSWREKAQSIEKAKPAESQAESKAVSFNKDEIDKLLDEKLQERDLDQAEVTDNVKSEVKAYAKAKGVTYREALNSPYVQFLQDKESVNVKNDKASIGGSRSATVKRNYDEIQPEQVKDLDDEGFEKYIEWLKSQG